MKYIVLLDGKSACFKRYSSGDDAEIVCTKAEATKIQKNMSKLFPDCTYTIYKIKEVK